MGTVWAVAEPVVNRWAANRDAKAPQCRETKAAFMRYYSLLGSGLQAKGNGKGRGGGAGKIIANQFSVGACVFTMRNDMPPLRGLMIFLFLVLQICRAYGANGEADWQS